MSKVIKGKSKKSDKGKSSKSSKQDKHDKQDKQPKSTKKKACSNLIYLDNNATTLMCRDAKNVMDKWLECYNPSSDSKVSISAKEVISKSRAYILRHCGVNEQSHYALFTSGATESNCMILRSTAESYRKARGAVPHFIVSAVEHHSILECLHIMQEHEICEYTEIPPTPEGSIKPHHVLNAIQPNTCLISIMFANNELGTINNIKAIGDIAHKKGIPMHTDAVQIFGKIRIFIDAMNIDAISISAHKWYGPKGQGILIISKSLVEGYNLQSQIAGSQQNGLRGGTENVPGIASMLTALQCTFKNRQKKNKQLLAMRNYVIQTLTEEWNRMYYRDFLTVCELKEPYKNIVFSDDPQIKLVDGGKNDDNEMHEDEGLGEMPGDEIPSEESKELESVHINVASLKGTRNNPKPIFVVLGPHEDEIKRYLPNTILISFINPLELPAYGTSPSIEPFCNVKLKHDLDKMNVVVSIASACLTSSDKASHVLRAIGAPSFIKRGVLRISFGDNNTMDEAKKFVKILKECIYKQI